MNESTKYIKYIEEISKTFIKENWTFNDLRKFMAFAGIKEKWVRDIIFKSVLLKTTMLESREER
ncbi:MAG: hypothetical protein LBF00_00350 [Mycoplasmataceae bacterium]|jgi:hypothetical protein|nr:hypothetical protein [Mycoplasmataceae bacterium]